MPKMSNPQLLTLREQPALSVRTRTKVSELPRLIGETYGKLAGYLAQLGEGLCDVPFVAYHNMDMEDLDVEIGFPVPRELPGSGDILSSVIPAGKAIFCMYRGAYSGMEPLYEEMARWIPQNGFQAVGTAYEYYYNDPSFPEEELLTRVVMPVK